MFAPSERARKGLIALLCGGLMPLGFAPFGWYPIPILAMAVLALVLRSSESRDALWSGWLFGIGQFGVGVSWVYISIYLYGNAGLALSIAVMLLLVLFLASYTALMAWVLARSAILSRGRFFLAAFPAAWTLAEWLRSWVLTGFPWLNVGYSQVESPLLGYAPIAGVYGVSWVTAISAGLVAWFTVDGKRLRGVGIAVGLLLLWLAGWALNEHYWTRPVGKTLTSTLVQGNIPQALKWKPEQQQITLERYAELTRRHLDSDLVVWPETAIPAFYDQLETSFIAPLREELGRHGVALVTGVPVLDKAQWTYFNSIISLEQPGRFYHKIHLVPFGEYLPLRDWLADVLGFLPVPEADFSAGSRSQTLLEAAGFPIGCSICYEIAFGEQLIRALPEAAFLINVSNDAWFGDSLAPHQHLEMARMRARESERDLLRATNTGISAIIAASGELRVRSRQFEMETVSGPVQPRTGATPYVRWGNWPVVSACFLVLLLASRLRRVR